MISTPVSHPLIVEPSKVAESPDAIFTILLVDDHPANLISLEELLQRKNYVFLKACNGNDALQIALKNPQIGLILLDVQMPIMDGFEVARLLKLNMLTNKIPIIFVTAACKEEKFAVKGFESGAADYLCKPLNITITRAKVQVFEEMYFMQLNLKTTIDEKNKVNSQLESFTKTIAHDLKTPLAGMISLVYLLQMNKQIQTIDDVKEEMEMLAELSTNLSDMISSMLEESRKKESEQKIEEIKVPELINQIIHLLRPATHIHILFQYNLPTLNTKKYQLQQVFQNLIGNALKYIEKEEGQIFIGGKDRGAYYEFFIQDNGPGIPEESLEKIFNKYETANTKSNIDSSTGIGLNTLKTIIEEQGGKIWVKSTVTKGSKFLFTWKK